jgi:serine/threonine protein phosphatase PrpC
VRIRVSAATDVGRVRAANEDSYVAVEPIYLVADGMGGHAHGDEASRRIAQAFLRIPSEHGIVSSGRILAAIAEANTAVRSISSTATAEKSVAGSTLAGVALVDDEAGRADWMAFNIGDSRIYTWSINGLVQLTTDHSAVQELIDSGEITRTQAATHPERNIVTRAVGVEDSVDADVWLMPAGGRQAFLICSDGLTKELTDAEIAVVFAEADSAGEFESVAHRLVAAALAAGGSDNVTVVAVSAEWTGASESAGRLPEFLEETAPRV